MLDWLESIAEPQYVPAILWTLAALAALVVVLVAVKLVRRASSGTFVAGGRNRKTRLAIMDATAVDSHRRLVLVRRDDVEHLLLIGGASDLVVEQNIRLLQPARRPAEGAVQAAPRPRPAEAPAPPQPRQPQPATPTVQPRPTPVTQRPHEPVSQVRPIQRTAPPAVATPPPASRAVVAAPAAKPDDIDETLLHELEVSLDNTAAKRPEPSLEDEMTRLLGELSGSRK